MKVMSSGRTLFALIVGALLFLVQSTVAQTSGFVYVATNQPTGNQVIQYSRSDNGALTQVNEIATGGLGGTGNGVGNLDPLRSQDSLVLTAGASLLIVVNAGSNQLSSIAAGSGGLHLLSTVASGGTFPNSVAIDGDLVYVVNAQGTPNITGFRVSRTGKLKAIPRSTRALPGGSSAAPHDIRFSPDGTRLIVTEGGTDQIDIFRVGDDGLVTGVVTQPSAGSGPFGLRFGRSGALLNAEANTASVSSYVLTGQDMLTVISAAVPDGQMATCWISLTESGKFAFVSNTASGTISAYKINGNGSVSLANAVAGSLGSGAPIDSALSSDNSFLYVDDSALARIVIFAIKGSNLTSLGSVDGLPTTLQGIAAQ